VAHALSAKRNWKRLSLLWKPAWKKYAICFLGKKAGHKPLPFRHGGLSLRSASDLTLSCFLSSSHARKGLVSRLLPSLNQEPPHAEIKNATDVSSQHHDPSPLQKEIQSAWDDLACRDSLYVSTKSPWVHCRCRLLVAQVSHTAAWLEAFPLSNVGNLLSPDDLRIAIALRTGAKIFESTKCRCGKIVDVLGLNGLSCTKNGPHTFSHQLYSQKIINPMDVTLGAWYRGQSLVWDTTDVETFARYHYKHSARQTGTAATEAAKRRKYNDLLNNYHFNQSQSKSLVCMVSPAPIFERIRKETCWHVWWLQGVTLVLPARVLGYCQREHC